MGTNYPTFLSLKSCVLNDKNHLPDEQINQDQ